MSDDVTISDDQFDECFKKFDEDKSGTVEKDEMAVFIKQVSGLVEKDEMAVPIEQVAGL